jgi:hypothetical protein
MSDHGTNEIEWAKGVLADDYQVSGIELFVKSPYSTIFKIDTDKGLLFLKTNNNTFNYEHKLIRHLQHQFPGHSLQVLFSNDALNAFITPHAGVQFDTYFKASADYAAIDSALMNYAHIQQNTDTVFLQKIAVRDLSLKKIEEIFYSALNTNMPYIPAEKKSLVLALRDKTRAAIQEVIEIGIHDGLEHGDFHFGNMLFDNGNVIYIDWAEATLSNPLFSLCTFNHSLVRRLGMASGSDFATKLSRKYLDNFAGFYSLSRARIDKAFTLTERIYPMYYMITMSDILVFDDTQTKWHDRMNNSLDEMITDFRKY